MTDHYQTLGVAPTATDREIKKAYFALVRQFPPETHAEDFRRIREAYEALSNPQTREEHDRARAAGGEVEPFSEHGPELGAQLCAAAAAIGADRPGEAVPILQAALAANPDVIVARDMLGVALMMSGDTHRAAKEFEELTRRDPTNPVFHVRLGHAYRDLKFDRPALAAYLKARELAPGELAIRFVLSDFHASCKRWNEALKELDEAAAMAAGRAERDWEPALRRVGVQLARKRTRLVRREVASLLASLPADEEVKKHVSDRLSSMAARAFALQRTSDGNYLLQVARSLDPERHLGRFPEKVTVPLERLPEATQAWLRGQPGRDIVKPLWSRGYDGPVAVLGLGLLALLAGAGLAAAALGGVQMWSVPGWAVTAALFTSGAWAAAAGIRRLRHAFRSPLGKFTTLHSHYLVQAELDRVTFWPLINLVRISTTHQHMYSVYTASSVRLRFGRRTASLAIRGKELAEGLANEAAQLRGRVLDLLNSGMLEADGEVDLIPRALFPGGKEKGAWRRRLLDVRWPAAAALAGALAVPVLVSLQARAQDDAAWEMAKIRGAEAISQFLDGRPDSRHAAEARALLDQELARGLRRLQQMHQDRAAVLGELLEALRRAGTNRVQVSHRSSAKLGGFRAPASLSMVGVDLAGQTSVQHQKRITHALQRRIDQLVGPNVVTLRDGLGAPAVSSPVKLQIASELGLSGEVYQLTDDEHLYFGLVLRSGVDVRLDGSPAPAHHYDVEARPSRELRWMGPKAGVPPRVTYSRMADSAAEAMGKQIALAMQLGE